MSISEKDAVLRERAAFVAGARYEDANEWGFDGDEPDSVAALKYPLPKIVQPRVWVERGGMGFKVVDGALWFTCTTDPEYVEWIAVDPNTTAHEVTSERIRAWADLLAHPTEEVDA